MKPLFIVEFPQGLTEDHLKLATDRAQTLVGDDYKVIVLAGGAKASVVYPPEVARSAKAE